MRKRLFSSKKKRDDGVDPAVLQAAQEMLWETGVRADVKDTIGRIARGDAGTTVDLGSKRLGPEEARALRDALKGSPHVVKLRLPDNRLGPDGARAIADGLKHVPNLQWLNLHNNRLGPEGARAIADGLRHVPSLQLLDLHNNGFGAEGAKAIVRGLKHVPNLQRASLDNNNLGVEGARIIADGLRHTPNLQLLDLQNNCFGAEGARAIVHGLMHVPNLQALGLHDNGVGTEVAREIANGLRHVPKLQLLDLSNNHLGSEGVRIMANGLPHVTRLRALALLNNLLGVDGVRTVADVLKNAKDLKLLMLGEKALDGEQLAEANAAYQRLSQLSCLHLIVTSVGPEAARVLGAAVPRSREVKASFKTKEDCNAFEAARPSTFTEHTQPAQHSRPATTEGSLSQGDSDVEQKVEELLGQAELREDVQQKIRQIARGEASAKVSFEFCTIGPAGVRALAEALKRSPHVLRLDLGAHNLGPEGARAIANGLEYIPNLQKLDLRANGLGPEGARAVADGLKHVFDLKWLSLDENQLGVDGIRAVAEAAAVHKGLKVVLLGDTELRGYPLQAVASTVRRFATLSQLHLFVSSIGPEAARVLGTAFPRSREVKANFTHKGDQDAFEEARPAISSQAAPLQQQAPEPRKETPQAQLPEQQQQQQQQQQRQQQSELELQQRSFPSKSPRAAPLKQQQQQQQRVTSFHEEASASQLPAAASSNPFVTSHTVTLLKQQLDAKDKELKGSQDLVQQLLHDIEGLREEAAAKGAQIEKQAKDLKDKDAALIAERAMNGQQAKELGEKDALIHHLETRIQELEQQVKDGSFLEQDAETALSLNIPPARFRDKMDATDSDGNPIAGAFSSLHTATLAGHRVAMKDIRPVKHRPRLSQLLACRGDSTTAISGTTAHNERLYREAAILLSIRHPNIVSFLGLSHDKRNNTLSFVLSWAEGGSLYDHMHVHKRELTHAQRARIAMEVAAAMQFLHAHGIVHRDLKSPNVLLDGSLSAKVTDFGLSAFKQGDDKTLTHQKGTPLWASPEQLLDENLYADTDVFSFGVLYWELCFNCKPWHHGKYKGRGASIAVIIKAYDKHQYLPLDEEINGTVLSATQLLLLGGCFDRSGNRLDFTQLHVALQGYYTSMKQHQQLDEKQQAEMLFGPEDAVWKFPQSLLEAVKAVTKQLPSRPSVSTAPLDLQQHVDAVKKLLAEAGGTTAKEANLLKPFDYTLAAVAITHDKQKEAAFNGALARNKTRYRGHLTSGSSHPFSPKYEHNTSTKELTNEEENQVLRHTTCGTAYNLLDPSLLKQDPPLRLQRVFHGVTSWHSVVGILGGDFANLQSLGALYGAGFYFSPDLDCALKFAREALHGSAVPSELQHLGLDASNEYRVVLACDVQYGNPYPVLDHTTFDKKALVPGHDAHVAVAGLYSAVPYASYKDWGGAHDKPVAVVAMNDTSCVLVRAVLVFEA